MLLKNADMPKSDKRNEKQKNKKIKKKWAEQAGASAHALHCLKFTCRILSNAQKSCMLMHASLVGLTMASCSGLAACISMQLF